MYGLRVTHVLFDLFGTLVDYFPSGAEHGFARSHDLTRTLGAALTYDEFLAAWAKISEQFRPAERHYSQLNWYRSLGSDHCPLASL